MTRGRGGEAKEKNIRRFTYLFQGYSMEDVEIKTIIFEKLWEIQKKGTYPWPPRKFTMQLLRQNRGERITFSLVGKVYRLISHPIPICPTKQPPKCFPNPYLNISNCKEFTPSQAKPFYYYKTNFKHLSSSEKKSISS